MSRYRLQWRPQGAIPQDLNLKLTLNPVVTETETVGGGCTPTFAGYAVTGDATYNLPASTSLPTWNWPCPTSGWSILIIGFGIPCGGVYSWDRTVQGDDTIESHVTYTEGTDPQNNPTLTVAGDDTTCDDDLFSTSLLISLKLNGGVFGGTLVLSKTKFMTILYDTQIHASGSFWTGPPGTDTAMVVSTANAAGDNTYQWKADGSSGAVNWFSDTSSVPPGWTVTVIPAGPIQIQVHISGGGPGAFTGWTVRFMAQDTTDGTVVAPPGALVGAPGPTWFGLTVT